MKIAKSIFVLLAAALSVACSQQPKEKPLLDVIGEAMTFAEQQSIRMAESLATTDSVLPRMFENGKLITSSSRWWCSGFYPGTLWYLYENSNNPELLKYAKLYTARVEREKYTTNNHDVGFMLYCSFGNGFRITGDTSYIEVLLTGSKSLCTRYNPQIELIKSWQSNKKWQYPVIIDNMMNLEMLMWASKRSGDPTFRDISVKHANKTIKEHYRPDYSCFHVISYDTLSYTPEARNTHQGFSDESAWARGQAWGLYGYAMMYRETQDPAYLDQAKKIAAFLLNHPNMPKDYIPYWDFNAPNIPNEPRDASAGAIICSALIELSDYVDAALAKEYLGVAETQIRTFASPEYTAKAGENGNFILMHSVGSLPHKSEVDVPLTYADYYYVEAMMRMKNKLNRKQ